MRLIDADELNEYIGRESLDTREKIFALVDRMPTLPNPCGKPCAFERPHGKWVPCSERLPERDEIVLVSFKTGMVQMCKYLDDGSPYSWWSYKDDCLAWNNTVDAWMPLPEQYKEEGGPNG